MSPSEDGRSDHRTKSRPSCRNGHTVSAPRKLKFRQLWSWGPRCLWRSAPKAAILLVRSAFSQLIYASGSKVLAREHL